MKQEKEWNICQKENSYQYLMIWAKLQIVSPGNVNNSDNGKHLRILFCSTVWQHRLGPVSPEGFGRLFDKMQAWLYLYRAGAFDFLVMHYAAIQKTHSLSSALLDLLLGNKAGTCFFAMVLLYSGV